MIENTDAEQIERLNARVAELLRDRDGLVKALEHIAGKIPANIRCKCEACNLVDIADVALAVYRSHQK